LGCGAGRHLIYIANQGFEVHGVAISEINRVLRKKDFLLVNFLSKRTYSCGKGVEIEESTFIE